MKSWTVELDSTSRTWPLTGASCPYLPGVFDGVCLRAIGGRGSGSCCTARWWGGALGLVLLDLDQQREERGQESGAYSHRNQISSG